LTDEPVNLFFALLSRARDDVMFWQSSFYPQFVKFGFNDLVRCVNRLGKPSYKKVFVPVHEKAPGHWFLVVMDFEERIIESMDSLNTTRPKERENLLKWVEMEWNSSPRWKGTYERKHWKSRKAHVPCQSNNFDCGVFMCMFAAYRSHDEPIMFTQANMTQMRKRLAWSIIHETLE
ncbi:unnamed protein product, partial [Ectocarpus sp. 12 AP-2014]